MAVMRVEKTDGFTVMSNCHLRDKTLSLKAVGLLSKILSLPSDWDYTVEGLVTLCKESRAAVDAAIHELEAGGYIVRERARDDRGRLTGCNYTVYERPVKETKSPICDFPKLDNPILENREQINTESTKDLNIPPIVPQEGDGVSEKKSRKRKRAAKSIPEHEPEMFERFWRKYPRGEDRQGAVAEWDKLKPDRELMFAMSAALDRMLASDEWRRGVGIPYACRWLSKRRWTDEDRKPETPPDSGGWAESQEVI